MEMKKNIEEQKEMALNSFKWIKERISESNTNLELLREKSSVNQDSDLMEVDEDIDQEIEEAMIIYKELADRLGFEKRNLKVLGVITGI